MTDDERAALTTLTLADIRAHRPCFDGWRALLTVLGYTLPVDARTIADFDGLFDPARVVSIGDIARSNSAEDALWCLRCLPDTVETRHLAVAMILPSVKRASVHTTDQRVHDCIAAVERWHAGDDTVDLGAAENRAWTARAAARAEEAASAASAASWAAAAASWAAAAAEDAWETERAQQVDDIIAVSPLHALKEDAN